MKRTQTEMLRRAGKAAAMLALLLLAAVPASAQTAQDRYPVDKTVDDYMAGQGQDAAGPGYDYAAQQMRTSIWLDRDEDDVYRRDDRQSVGFETNQDAYAVVYRIDTDGLVTVLWPRSRLDNGFVFGGHEYELPVRGAEDLRVGDREGEGFVAVVVSIYPFDLRALELDFHHEPAGERYGFRVAGDPFLAMNEVNFAITGLEDAKDFVITNHVRYYVHRQVDHPRYLCNQCHFDDDVAYDPYNDTCTLNISYDYHWGNSWYDTYGYYPVYWNPVYAYYDPWTWRPWVNFWYRPWYRCAPYYSWHTSFWDCYTWYDSPYYRGDCGTYWQDGHRRYRPLSRYPASAVAQKTRDYSTATRVVRGTPTDRQRAAMSSRSALKNDRGAVAVAGRGDVRLRGEQPVARTRTKLEVRETTRTRPGLRIRDTSGARTSEPRAVRDPADNLRHRSAGSGSRAQLSPVQRTPRAGESTLPRDGGTSRIRTQSRPSTKTDDRSVRTVEPRQRGSRVWNTQRGDAGRDTRTTRPTTRSRSGESDRGSVGDVRVRTPRSERQPSRSGTVERRQTPQRSQQRAVQPQRQDSGATQKRDSGVQPRSSGQSRDSGSKSTPRSSGSSSGKRDRGGSRTRR